MKTFFFNTFINNDTKNWRVRYIENILKRWYCALRFFLHPRNENLDAVSIVVVGRNDNYGGDFSERLKTTIDWNYQNFPNAELVYVEWNQIPDRDSDTNWIIERYPNAKCFIVPQEIHNLYADNPNIKMMEYFAKNLGVRKATNNWIAILNADVVLDKQAISNLKKVNRKFAYGTHYINIKWNGEPITNDYLKNPENEINRFSTNNKLRSVVGNFLMMHRESWMKMGGYDESLRNVRLGVDNNGLEQILYMKIHTAVAGSHYHLNHAESTINNVHNPTHGSNEKIFKSSNIPYKNPSAWGLSNYELSEVKERVWKLKT